jgi:mono/diheme cytochrome c family protein
VRNARISLLTLVILGLAIQLVPYGRRHGNPEMSREPDWDRPQTRELFFRACKDCHSSETEWPWYSFVAPASWLVERDVEEGRSHFNISEWGRDENHGDEAAKLVREGEMPLWFYLLLHPEARLSDEDLEELIRGLAATFGEQVGDGHEHVHEN